MLPPTVVDNFRRILDPEYQARDHILAKEFARKTGEFVAAGSAQSGRAIVSLVELAAEEMTVRAGMAYQQLIRVSSAHGVPLDEEFGRDTAHLLEEYLWEVREQLRRQAAEQGALKADPGTSLAALQELDRTTERLIARQKAEIDLMVAQAQRQAAQGISGGNTFNVAGNVGVIQTGAGSFAVSVQHVDQSTKQRVSTVLTQLDKEIDKLPEGALPVPRDEVKGMVRSCLEEAAKQKPNSTMLKTMLVGLAQTIQTVASLQPMYEALKGILAPLGITLP